LQHEPLFILYLYSNFCDSSSNSSRVSKTTICLTLGGGATRERPNPNLFLIFSSKILSLLTNQIWCTYEHFSRLTFGDNSSHRPCSLKRNNNFLNPSRYLYSIHIPSFVILAQTVLEFPKRRFFGLEVGGVTRERPQPNIYFYSSEEDLSVYLPTKSGAHPSIFRV
jgi:hypothetical protein